MSEVVKPKSFWPLQPQEIELLTPGPRAGIVEWAEQNLWMPKQETRVPGLFSFEYSPYLRQPAEDLSDHHTREVWIQAPTQGSKSTLSNLFASYIMEVDPGHLMIAMPDENTVKRRMKGRIRPFFQANPKLMELIGGRIENLNVGEVTTMPWMNLYIAWAHSAATMADVPVRHIIADEVAKFPGSVGREADPINLLRDRQKTFEGLSKLLGLSSPVLVGDLFDREFKDGLVHAYYLQCSHCDRFFLPSNDDMILAKGPDRDFLDPRAYENDRDEKLAWFACPLCHQRWTFQNRAWATQHGVWVPDGCRIDEKGTITGEPPAAVRKSYAVTTFMVHPLFQPIRRLAAAWVRAIRAKRAGNTIPLQHYRNSQQGLPWEVKTKSTKADDLVGRIDAYPMGFVPWGVQFLTAGLDVQLDHVWIMVKGWGFMGESWMVWAGRIDVGDTNVVDNLRKLDAFLIRGWPSAVEGQRDFRMAMAAVDCGYHWESVMDWCRVSEAPLIPVRGEDRVTKRTYNMVKEKETDMVRYDLNTNAIKDRLYHGYWETQDPGPGYAHLPAGTMPEVLQHLASEDKVLIPKGDRHVALWQPKSEHTPNHLWDCEVYATAAAEISGLWALDRLPPSPPPAARPAKGKGEPKPPGFLDDLPELL
jgi:phage terminase large subunit GpA-like protein